MIGIGHLKRRFGQYAALWVGGFLIAGAAILIGLIFADLMTAIDWVLPIMMAILTLAAGAGLIMTLMSGEAVGTKILALVLALLLILPLLWAPVSAAVAIAFFADRSIEYSSVYAAFRIGVSDLLYPLSQRMGLIDAAWQAFQWAASVVGFISALSNIWPILRRLLGPEPTQA